MKHNKSKQIQLRRRLLLENKNELEKIHAIAGENLKAVRDKFHKDPPNPVQKFILKYEEKYPVIIIWRFILATLIYFFYFFLFLRGSSQDDQFLLFIVINALVLYVLWNWLKDFKDLIRQEHEWKELLRKTGIDILKCDWDIEDLGDNAKESN